MLRRSTRRRRPPDRYRDWTVAETFPLFAYILFVGGDCEEFVPLEPVERRL